MTEVQHHYVPLNGLTFHIVTAGPADGRPIVLLHGFPEFWYGWKAQIDYLAQAGYRVIVPDQRGYNLTDKPHDVKAYHIDLLVSDVIALIDHFGYEKTFIAAHDWGAAVAWWLVKHQPERVEKLAILNVPYPTFTRKAFQEKIRVQVLKSWYIYFFQIPLLPEILLSLLARSDRFNLLSISSLPSTFSAEDIAHYRAAWAKPRAWRSMVNWYRAAIRLMITTPFPEPKSIKIPTLILWGEQDIALDKRLAKISLELCADGELVYYPEATHWLQHDETEAVNEQLQRFFQV